MSGPLVGSQPQKKTPQISFWPTLLRSKNIEVHNGTGVLGPWCLVTHLVLATLCVFMLLVTGKAGVKVVVLVWQRTGNAGGGGLMSGSMLDAHEEARATTHGFEGFLEIVLRRFVQGFLEGSSCIGEKYSTRVLIRGSQAEHWLASVRFTFNSCMERFERFHSSVWTATLGKEVFPCVSTVLTERYVSGLGSLNTFGEFSGSKEFLLLATGFLLCGHHSSQKNAQILRKIPSISSKMQTTECPTRLQTGPEGGAGSAFGFHIPVRFLGHAANSRNTAVGRERLLFAGLSYNHLWDYECTPGRPDWMTTSSLVPSPQPWQLGDPWRHASCRTTGLGNQFWMRSKMILSLQGTFDHGEDRRHPRLA